MPWVPGHAKKYNNRNHNNNIKKGCYLGRVI
jgi:hypothetical protein